MLTLLENVNVPFPNKNFTKHHQNFSQNTGNTLNANTDKIYLKIQNVQPIQ